MPTRLLSEEEKEDIVNVDKSSGNNVVGRNFMHGKFGKFLNSMKVDYLTRKKNANNGAESDDIEFMLERFCKSKEIHFTTLTDMPISLLDLKDNQNESHQSESTMSVSTTKTQSGNPINTPISDNPSIFKVKEKAKLEQVERRMKKTDILFISIAWIVIPAFHFFIYAQKSYGVMSPHIQTTRVTASSNIFVDLGSWCTEVLVSLGFFSCNTNTYTY